MAFWPALFSVSGGELKLRTMMWAPLPYLNLILNFACVAIFLDEN
jgi:hypothetical protein